MNRADPARPVIAAFNSGPSEDDDMLRLHLNETPYGPPKAALEAAGAELDRRCAVYPDSEASALRDRLAAHLDVETAMVTVGNGVDELVLLTALALLGPGRSALVTDTTFPGYRSSTAIAGAEVRPVPLHEHRVSADAIGAALRATPAPDVAFICNPVNPTGTVLGHADIRRIVADSEAAGTIAVFDEAYLDFAGPTFDHAVGLVRAGHQLLVLRTFSKAWGLAALRVGYAVGPAALIAKLLNARNCVPFNTNRPAQHAAAAALGDADFPTRVRERTADARSHLYLGLDALSVSYVPSVANFVLVHTGGDSGAVAAELAEQHRILVRDLTPFGLPGDIRVTVGTHDQMDAFCRALRSVLTASDPGTVEHLPVPAEEQGLVTPENDPVERAGAENTEPAGKPSTAHWNLPVPTLPALDPAAMLNGHLGANTVFALRELGIWDLLLEGHSRPEALIAAAGAQEDPVRALLRTAALLGLIELSDDRAALTGAGHETLRQIGFFTWAVGGYGDVLRSLAPLATGDATFGATVRRDEALVAAGSSEAGRLMAPLQADVLGDLSFNSVADIGCGDGRRLMGLCRGEPPRRGLGLDISAAACAEATRRIADAGLASHIDIARANIFAGDDRPVFPGIDLVTSFLMLHDLFTVMPGEEAVRLLRTAFPDARHFLIADTVIQPWADRTGPPPAFSAAFELVHAFMGVPLRTKEAYEHAFSAAGLDIARREELPVPSTWLYLLRVP
ncbi:aminotransferase class I/II-fold pyridoxal phosphate-dependent enzyme [Streptomyces sp. NPDC092307]|uniref:aminotransferase class I/II-fold pyridoxal phosphate-dependent enzyme n=1 Tax=Streptomyces sp. NPDC092307 TaxID=3366013 RepID=UPI0038265903